MTGPVQNARHLTAAMEQDLQALKMLDADLAELLESDEGIIAEDASAAQAFDLYCSTIVAFDGGSQVERSAFQAVVSGNVDLLTELIRSGRVLLDVTNRGGQTLLDMARERGQLECEEVLLKLWKLCPPQKERTFDTPDDTYYYVPEMKGNISTSGTIRYLVVSVMAQSDAHIGLFHEEIAVGVIEDPRMSFYEVVIGGWENTRCTMRRNRGGESRVDVKGAFCSQLTFRDFWISVDSSTGRVAFGSGRDIDAECLMEFTDKHVLVPVNFAIMTGYGSSGVWKFPEPANDTANDAANDAADAGRDRSSSAEAASEQLAT